MFDLFFLQVEDGEQGNTDWNDNHIQLELRRQVVAPPNVVSQLGGLLANERGSDTPENAATARAANGGSRHVDRSSLRTKGSTRSRRPGGG